MNRFKNVANELGKTFLNISVAVLVFLLLQPFVKGELTFKLVIMAVGGFLINVIAGSVLIYLGGDDNER
ncbi:hypothetical protein [Hydrogenivirga sp. 128-5-R1-1]|uniref:hypothetical protein n=1 Tax=Hydrogenivirga sp. 128-5-R1-1 TaxID=392423 RepID=UPI00015F1269|nr:hypothetical protein [Hydrogenivirga sp. 128-5-R1-1]EDP73742.1 hypothetical protein HG1285_11058 [Hydrogenivirga sp. 128-5-R1-1]